MSEPNAALAGQFSIGGDLTINRLGFGAMRITGEGIWGQPKDVEEARRVLRRLKALGVNFVDTAESYGPEVSEQLIADELYPYDGFVIATKAGLQRPGPNHWVQDGRPEVLRRGLEASLRRLKVERIDLWQLHRIDSKVPRDEQFAAIAGFVKDGLVRHVGLSEVTVEEIEAAQKYFPVATIQNRYNLFDRASEEELEFCEANAIGFIPWAPLASGRVGGRPVLEAVAQRHGASPGQIALAWMLKRSPVILPIPGTGKVAHLEENVAAAGITLSEGDMAELEGAS
ncbi:aldo/keto reductase [Paradevosia shaoguanensis]|uniref:aldo/keto reductase n=1 Tax=Paradevosia shaoguanensis TaxID=1335043 RepID=UPI00193438DB|nr:aldo/keto reductase [Paradevosia shaoguanensis]